MKNPIEVVIDKAIGFIRTKDPSWDVAQPQEFKARVVEVWKKQIRSVLFSNTRVLWQLEVGDKTFGCHAPLFLDVNWEYNPYLLDIPRPFSHVKKLS